MWPSHSLVLDVCPADNRLQLHVTNKGSPMVITVERIAQIRAHPYRRPRVFLF
jgi:hypothetical protein